MNIVTLEQLDKELGEFDIYVAESGMDREYKTDSEIEEERDK